MIRMLCAFNLKCGQDEARFRADYEAFVADLYAAGLIREAGPVGRRVSDTPMDTDDDRPQEFLSVLSFRDREQLDAAYAHIEARRQPATTTHLQMYRCITNSVFLCWDEGEG